LIVFEGRAGAVDHAHVGQRDHARVGADKLSLGSLREHSCSKTRTAQEKSEFDFHGFRPGKIFAIRYQNAARRRDKFTA
jgi:hypothetical protein